MIMPVLPKLVENFMGGDTARAAEIFGVFGTAWALMQFFFSPVLGALSDSYGRRPVVLISNFGLGLDYVLMALAPNLWWLFAGRVISGISSASHRDELRLCHRRHAGRAARGEIRPAGRGLRARLRAGSGARRRARRDRSAHAVLGCGGAQPAQCALRPVRAAGIAAARAAHPVRMEARQSGRLAQAAPLASRIERACGVGVSRDARPCGAAERLACSMPATATAGTSAPWGFRSRWSASAR